MKNKVVPVPRKEPYNRIAALQPFRIELTGNCEMDIDGCRGIVAYDSDCIKIALPKMILCIYGRGLTIRCMTRESVTLCGCILRTEFIT
ncbi:MAG: YabP/YqfC family sporulation protein [Acutalibacteraceae bacterium]|jgi:sporulation protein YqfC